MAIFLRLWKTRKGKVGIIFIIFILFIVVCYVGVEWTSTPEFCGLCHEIEPAITSWKQSEHYLFDGKIRANCRDCHIPSWDDPIAVLSVKITHGCKDVYHHFDVDETIAKEPDYYFRLKQNALLQINDSTCLQCHEQIRDPSKDIIVIQGRVVHGLHSQPEAKKVSCMMCHKSMGHKEINFNNNDKN